jgi:hypothetical protein
LAQTIASILESHDE